MKSKSNFELKRININIPADLFNEVRAYAQKIGVNYTTAYIILLNFGLDKEKFKTYYNNYLGEKNGKKTGK